MGVKISNWWRTWSWLVVPEEKEEKEEEKETEAEGEEGEKKTASTGMFSLFSYLELNLCWVRSIVNKGLGTNLSLCTTHPSWVISLGLSISMQKIKQSVC